MENYLTGFTVLIILEAILYGSPFEEGRRSSNHPLYPFSTAIIGMRIEAPLSETSQKIIGDNEICSVVETVSIEDDSPWNPVRFVCCRGQMED